MPLFRSSRPVLAAGLALAVGFLLAGCVAPGSHPIGERSLLDLELSSNGIMDGATYTTVATANPGEGGLGSSTSTSTRLSISIVSGRTITDPARAIDYLARTVWSIAGPRPTGDVEIAVAGGFTGTEAEWAEAAERVLGPAAVVSTFTPSADDPDDASPNDALPLEIRVPASSMSKFYGSWPGPRVKSVSFTKIG